MVNISPDSRIIYVKMKITAKKPANRDASIATKRLSPADSKRILLHILANSVPYIAVCSSDRYTNQNMTKCTCLISALIFSLCAVVEADESPAIYLDPNQPTDKRVDDLISKMTLAEKAISLFHNSPGVERLHIPRWDGWNQCLHGVWSKQATTLFPASIAAAATWDPALVHEEANALSDEGRALYNTGAQGPQGPCGLVYRAPVINISRDPRWGRIQECYGEDPYLTSQLGVAYVKGLQGDDPKYLKVAATLKHYAVNNQETNRLSLSADVPERMLYEYWLPHFKACIVDGQAQSIMAAYNSINGVPCIANKLLLTDILRNDWGFKGFVVCDLTGVKHLMDGHHITNKPEEAVAAAILAGCDYDDEQYRDSIPTAVKDGLIKEADVDNALRRVMTVAMRLGVFDPPGSNPFSKIPGSVIDSPEHRQLSLKLEQQSIVLLSNPNHILPLDKSKLKNVAVIGPEAEHPEYGDYFFYGTDLKKVTPLQGITDRLGLSVQIASAQGCGVLGRADPVEIAKAVRAAQQADVAILFLGTSLRIESEDRDRHELGLPPQQEQLLEAVCNANPKTVVVLMNAGPLSVSWARDHAAAVVEGWFPGEEGGHAIADVLLGAVNPGGKLPYTVYESTADIPPQTEYDITKGFTYMYFGGKPVFPFGYGLSYTQFAYSNFAIASHELPTSGTMDVSVDVKNIGDVGGDEVAQLYIHQEKCSVPQPIKKLVGFSRVHLAPGESQAVHLKISAQQLSFYDVDSKKFAVEPGTFDVMVGSSSADIRATDKFDVGQRLAFQR
jgi:beta-glucosidase